MPRDLMLQTALALGADQGSFVRSVLSWHARHVYRAMDSAKYVYDEYRKPVNEAWLRYVERTRHIRRYVLRLRPERLTSFRGFRVADGRSSG